MRRNILWLWHFVAAKGKRWRGKFGSGVVGGEWEGWDALTIENMQMVVMMSVTALLTNQI